MIPWVSVLWFLSQNLNLNIMRDRETSCLRFNLSLMQILVANYFGFLLYRLKFSIAWQTWTVRRNCTNCHMVDFLIDPTILVWHSSSFIKGLRLRGYKFKTSMAIGWIAHWLSCRIHYFLNSRKSISGIWLVNFVQKTCATAHSLGNDYAKDVDGFKSRRGSRREMARE